MSIRVITVPIAAPIVGALFVVLYINGVGVVGGGGARVVDGWCHHTVGQARVTRTQRVVGDSEGRGSHGGREWELPRVTALFATSEGAFEMPQ
jgi:hypothetical protein